MNEPNAAMPSAGRRVLARHLGPSRRVTTDAASPGMLMRIEVIEPP
jgi:hypothetical protein